MLAMAGAPDEIGTRDVSGWPLLSAAAGAKSREEPSEERPRAGSDEAFGANSGRKRIAGAVSATGGLSELAQVHGFEHSDRHLARLLADSLWRDVLCCQVSR